MEMVSKFLEKLYKYCNKNLICKIVKTEEKIKPIEKFRGILKESIGDSELEERFEEAMAKEEL